VVRDGEVIAERHRFDSRLSIAVLHRLDKRCDRAAEQGARHLPAVSNWETFLTHIGRSEDEAAEALLQTPPHGQFGQLPLGENPIQQQLPPPSDEDREPDLSVRCWQDDGGQWMTNFPPPPDYDGYERGTWRDLKYQRDCTEEEAALLDANEQAIMEEERSGDADLRDAWFALLAGGADALPSADTVSPPSAKVIEEPESSPK
jgi:hypothetical protein